MSEEAYIAAMNTKYEEYMADHKWDEWKTDNDRKDDEFVQMCFTRMISKYECNEFMENNIMINHCWFRNLHNDFLDKKVFDNANVYKGLLELYNARENILKKIRDNYAKLGENKLNWIHGRLEEWYK
jgi:hypothetical protein